MTLATVLLLGGTSETAPLAHAISGAGFAVLISTSSEIPLDVGATAHLRRRTGRLDEAGLLALLRAEAVAIVVDATHPYAVVATHTARAAAAIARVPYVRFERPPALNEVEGIARAPNHDTAAVMAFGHGCAVLLTIGSRHLEPYVRAARAHRLSLWARVLDHPESWDACLRVGLCAEEVIRGRGPFSVQQNRETICRLGVGVLVTKDGGDAGGARAKVLAAKEERCRVVVVERPADAAAPGAACTTLDDVVDAVTALRSRAR